MRSGFITAELMKRTAAAGPSCHRGFDGPDRGGRSCWRRGWAQGRAVEFIESRTAGEPIIAVVSLRSQRITVYDADGWIFRAPVSSGQKGRETPAGIFSVIQKNAEHYSNLYDDAYMPHMQRLTWSGIALHGGALPGYPASHGCVRMPFDFAARLFDATRMGMRVIVAPGDAAPVEIAHPALFAPKPGAAALAAARAAEANEAAEKGGSGEARGGDGIAGGRAGGSAGARSGKPETQSRGATGGRRGLRSAPQSPPKQRRRPRRPRQTAVARIAELQAQWAAARAELQPKLDAVAPARDAAVAAEAARVAAVQAAREVALDLEPVSVFISRKTQRLYVRRGFEPVLESEVTISASRSSDRDACLHRDGADQGRRQLAVDRCLIGRWKSARRGRADGAGCAVVPLRT